MRPVVCRYEHFKTEWYERSRKRLNLPSGSEEPLYGNWRKSWEWAAIYETLEQKEKLRPGCKGIGFAVGQEPLVSAFAARGIDILATDLAPGEISEHWAATGEYAVNLEALFKPDLVSEEQFHEKVRFAHADMNDIAALPTEEFDFLWSSCAIEHVGSIELATRFAVGAMRLLKPGGIAVHTTEFNCSSNTATVTEGADVIFRRRDIEELAGRLRLIRCGMEEPDYDMGVDFHDLDYDEPPYFSSGRKHLKLFLGGFVATSFLIVIHKS